MSPKLFFLVFFQCGYVCVRVVVVRFFETARDDGFGAFAVAPPARPGFEPGLASTRRTPQRLVHVSCGLTHLGRFDTARPRPMRDAARRRCRRPPARGTRGVLLANNPRTERTIAHHDRSIVRVRSYPPPRVVRRSEGGGGESVINRFAAVPSGLVRGGVDASSPVSSSRDAAVRTSLPPHRDGGERAVHPSARRPVARLLESRYLILSYLSATSKKEKRKTNRARFSIARAGGRLRVPK